MSEIPMFILYFDALLKRKAFAGPYDHVPEAEAARLSKAGHEDVEFIRTRDIAPWMPALKLDLPVTAGELRAIALRGAGLCVITGWDNVASAFEGQTAEVVSSDGEKFEGRVTEIDVARCTIWVELEVN